MHRHFHYLHGRRIRRSAVAVAFGARAQDRRDEGRRRPGGGLLTLLLALVLGTLIGVSFAYFSTQRTNLETFSAQILRLDQALAQ
jgi:hypothetical protein